MSIENRVLYCNNCGGSGHLYRYCRQPVLSYGVICINNDKILMIQRKDSLAYIEFLRGKYDINNKSYLIKLFNGCSLTEREHIKQLSFEELWAKLWLTDGIHLKTERMSREYSISQKHFKQLKLSYINELLDSCTTTYETPEWEFPKGRRNVYETNIQCGLREFEEETNLSTTDYVLLDNVEPLDEEYIGSNGVRYKHIYYVAFYKGSNDLAVNQSSYEQYSEIGDLAWLTVDECFARIRKEQTTKIGIVEQVKNFNDMWINDFNLKE